MASYCVAEDVSILLGFDTFTTSTRPTLAQVNTIIADITNEIDFVLSSAGINSQPTDSRVLGRLKIACKMGTAAQVGMSAFGNNNSVDNSQPNKYWVEYQKILEEIKSSPEVYGYITGASGVYMSNPVEDGTYSEGTISGGFIDRDYKY